MARRAAIYVRVSTTRQAQEGLSLEAQEARVREYVERQSWELRHTYVEAGVSGRKDKRPQLLRLLEDLDDIDCVVIPKLDRLGRSNKHLHEVFEKLEAADVQLVSLADNIDTSTPMGKFMRSVLAALAEFESDLISERVRSVAGARASKGLHSGPAAYGYKVKDGKLVAVEPERSIAQRIFREAAEGVSQRQINARLNKEGVKGAKGGLWQQSTIARMLTNQTYIGKVGSGDNVFDGEHEAIIDLDTWNKVQAIKSANAAARPKGGGRQPRRHLFGRGHLRCLHCGSAMVAGKSRGGKDFYRCRSEQEGVPCEIGHVPRETVDTAVFDYFAAVGLDLEETRAQLLESASEKQSELIARLKDAQRSERTAADAVNRVRGDYTSGAITAAEWRELRAPLEQEQEAARDALKCLEEASEAEASAADAIMESEDVALTRLAEIKAAVTGEVSGARDLDAVRSALLRLFESFEIARVPVDGDPLNDVERAIVTAQAAELDAALEVEEARPFVVGQWAITPMPRLELVEDIDIAWRPVLRRTSLALAAKNDALGSPPP